MRCAYNVNAVEMCSARIKKNEKKKHQLLYALKMANGTDFITGRIILYGIFFVSVYTHTRARARTHTIILYILYIIFPVHIRRMTSALHMIYR